MVELNKSLKTSLGLHVGESPILTQMEPSAQEGVHTGGAGRQLGQQSPLTITGVVELQKGDTTTHLAT